jgi:hypothetical protein
MRSQKKTQREAPMAKSAKSPAKARAGAKAKKAGGSAKRATALKASVAAIAGAFAAFGGAAFADDADLIAAGLDPSAIASGEATYSEADLLAAGIGAVPVPEKAQSSDATLLAAAFAPEAVSMSATTRIEEASMGEMRGGYRSIAFGIALFVDVSRIDPATQQLPEGITLTDSGPNQVQITTNFGGMEGANGIFQFTNVNGNLNVVNNTLSINVAIFESAPTDPSTIFDIFGGLTNPGG